VAFHIPYTGKTFTPGSTTIQGNETDPNPVQFDIVPAWGADQARVKSIVFATLGLVQTSDWTPSVQQGVIAAFETGAPVFVDTVKAIRNLSVPAALALRAGLIAKLPTKVREAGGGIEPDPDAPVPIETGRDFSRICGHPNILALAYQVACEIAAIGDKASQEVDPRFFGQPSGSNGKGTGQKAKGSNAKTARQPRSGRGTAGSDSTGAGT